jgi:hypothetical protein
VRVVACSALSALALSGAAIGDDYPPCAGSKWVVGPCWQVRGRVSLHNGNPTVRIWPIGSNRLLGVRNAEPPLLPPELGKNLSWDADVYADLKVCPLTSAREGKMQIVCVASVHNAIVRGKVD